MYGAAQKDPPVWQKITVTLTPLGTLGNIVMRAEQSMVMLRQGIGVFMTVLAAGAFIPWFDNAAGLETTDIGRYLSWMVPVPLALAAPPNMPAQPMRADLQALVNEHLVLRNPGAPSPVPHACP